MPRLGQDGTVWWRDVTATGAAAKQQNAFKATAGFTCFLLADVLQKHWSGWPCPELLAVLGKRICKRWAVINLKFCVIIAPLAKLGQSADALGAWNGLHAL